MISRLLNLVVLCFCILTQNPFKVSFRPFHLLQRSESLDLIVVLQRALRFAVVLEQPVCQRLATLLLSRLLVQVIILALTYQSLGLHRLLYSHIQLTIPLI